MSQAVARLPAPAAVLAVPLAAAAAGVLLAVALHDGDGPRPAPRPVTVAVGHARLEVPPGWARVRPRSLPDLGAGPRVTLRRGDAEATVAELAPVNASLLPASLTRAAAGADPRIERTGTLQLRRFDRLRGPDARRPLSVWAAATTAGTVTVVCAAPAAERDPCRPVLARLRLEGATALTPDGDAALRERLPSVLATLNRRRADARRDLAAARTPAAAADAATRLSRAEVAAYRVLRPLAAPSGDGAEVVRRVGRLVFGYGGLAQALRARDDRRVGAVSATIASDERSLAAALDRLGRR